MFLVRFGIGKFNLEIFLIEDLHLGLHQENGVWQIDGIDGFDSHKLTWDVATSHTCMDFRATKNHH